MTDFTFSGSEGEVPSLRFQNHNT